MPELKEKMDFANGRRIQEEEEMRAVHFRLLRAAADRAQP
jgi:hypothetical protein